jgi:hypothetical protein
LNEVPEVFRAMVTRASRTGVREIKTAVFPELID